MISTLFSMIFSPPRPEKMNEMSEEHKEHHEAKKDDKYVKGNKLYLMRSCSS